MEVTSRGLFTTSGVGGKNIVNIICLREIAIVNLLVSIWSFSLFFLIFTLSFFV